MGKIYHQDFNPDWYQMGLCEYMLLANPDERVAEKVMREKELFYDWFGAEIATKTLPHITVANFLIKGRMEALLCKGIQNACNLQYSFLVGLKDFNGFRPNAIYIGVQNPKPFRRLAKNLERLNGLIESNGCPPSQFVTRPHMTIARQLDEETYDKAMVEYAQRRFQDLFTLDKLTLLKRDSRYKKWQHVTHLYLPVERTLFN